MMPGLYAQWERWAADVTGSHTTYLPLARFRSPRPLSSWVTALLAELAAQAGAPEPDVLARQLHLLYDGSGQAARMDHDPAAAAAARAAAAILLDAARAGPVPG